MKAQARHILVKTADEAEKLKQRIANGEAFDVLAKKFSTCPSGKRGGDLGEVRPGQLVGAIDQVIFKKPLRVVHGPIKSKFGYHLVQTFYRDLCPQRRAASRPMPAQPSNDALIRLNRRRGPGRSNQRCR